MKSEIDIFVTYSSSLNSNDNEKVYSFVELLRKKGYNAQCDKNRTSVETASNFPQIMNDGLLSDKVIAFLTWHLLCSLFFLSGYQPVSYFQIQSFYSISISPARIVEKH